MKIGVLALQGGFDPHLRTFQTMNVAAEKVTTIEEIERCDALVLPGGESTTIGKLLVQRRMLEPLRSMLDGGFPAFGTCAGMILLSRRAENSEQPLLGVLDIDVRRNAYGRQIESFETTVEFYDRERSVERNVPALFIRAPQVARVGEGVQVLSTYEGLPVCVRRNKILAASFHPELTDSVEIHRYFLSMIG